MRYYLTLSRPAGSVAVAFSSIHSWLRRTYACSKRRGSISTVAITLGSGIYSPRNCTERVEHRTSAGARQVRRDEGVSWRRQRSGSVSWAPGKKRQNSWSALRGQQRCQEKIRALGFCETCWSLQCGSRKLSNVPKLFSR